MPTSWRILSSIPSPPPPVPLRRRSSSARRKWWRARWTGDCLASCGSASPPPGAILLVLLLTLGQEGLRIASDLWLGGKAEVSDVKTLLGIYVLLGRAPSPASWRCGSSTTNSASSWPGPCLTACWDASAAPPWPSSTRCPRGASSTASTGIWGGAGDAALHAGGTVRHAGVRGLAGGGDRHQYSPAAAHRPWWGWAFLCVAAPLTGRCNLLRRQSSVLRSRSTSASARPSAAPALRRQGRTFRALDQVLHHYDNNLRSWYTTTSINRWLGMHQTLLSAALVGAVALMVAFGNSPLLGPWPSPTPSPLRHAQLPDP